MSQIFMVRHAQVAVPCGMIYGREAVLSSRTPQEAFEAVAARLPHPARWISSDYPRAVETAQKLKKACDGYVPGWLCQWLTVKPAFGEQNFGDWQGHVVSHLRGKDPVFDQTDSRSAGWYDAAPPLGESFRQVVERVGRGIEALAADSCPSPYIVVCHGGTMRAAMVHTGIVTPEQAVETQIPHLALLTLETEETIGQGPRRMWRACLGGKGRGDSWGKWVEVNLSALPAPGGAVPKGLRSLAPSC